MLPVVFARGIPDYPFVGCGRDRFDVLDDALGKALDNASGRALAANVQGVCLACVPRALGRYSGAFDHCVVIQRLGRNLLMAVDHRICDRYGLCRGCDSALCRVPLACCVLWVRVGLHHAYAAGDTLAFEIGFLGVDRLWVSTLGVQGFDDGILWAAG